MSCDAVLTPVEAAALLKVRRTTVLDWLKSGHLRGSKLGHKTWRIRQADLDAFLERAVPQADAAETPPR